MTYNEAIQILNKAQTEQAQEQIIKALARRVTELMVGGNNNWMACAEQAAAEYADFIIETAKASEVAA